MKVNFFCLINGTPKNVKSEKMKFLVDAEKTQSGNSYTPNRVQFREKLPHRWRKAFDREKFVSDPGKPNHCYINLKNKRSDYITTIYCGLEN